MDAVFDKSLGISIRLYNKGLQKTGQMDLTGAAETLRQAIAFDKKNHMARNLLGLIYYEMGQIGDALREWIISTNLVRENNHAMDYIAKLQDNIVYLNKKNEAVERYNTAFMSLEEEDFDRAIGYLTEALEINGHFVAALNLLTLCYHTLGNKEEAINTLSRVLKIDKNNPTALRYHLAITGQKHKNQVMVGNVPIKITTPTNSVPISNYTAPVREPSRGFRVIDLTHIASFVIGSGIVFVMLYFFVMPGWIDGMEDEIERLEQALTTSQETHQTAAAAYQSRIETSEGRNLEQESTIHFLQDQLAIFIQNQTITDVQELVYQGDMISAAEILFHVDMSIVTPDRFVMVSELREAVLVEAAQELYNRGYQAYLTNNLIIAQGYLTTSLRYTDEVQTPLFFVDDAIFFLGRIAQLQGDYQAAIINFTTVINNFPGQNVYNSAQMRLAEVEAALLAAEAGEDELLEEGDED